MTRRRRRPSTLPVRCWQAAGMLLAVALTMLAADGFGWAISAVVGWVTR